jgi:hypothetical protein
MNNKISRRAGKMRGRVILATALCLAFVAAAALTARAQWLEDGTVVAAYDGYQGEQHMVPDGNGGAFLAWTDDRPGPAEAVFAQRFDAYGKALWAAGGVPVTMTISYDQHHTNIVPVGDGGAIVVYAHEYSATNTNIRAQRLDADGNMLWTTVAITICAAVGDQTYPVAISDGEGGAVIAWQDGRMGNADVYAQRVDSSGVVQWTADGVAVCSAAENQYGVVIVPDGNHGAIISWTDFRAVTHSDIYAQRIRYNGVPIWTANGVTVCTASGYQYNPQMIALDGGGAIATWTDYRAVTHADIYAQRLDAGGWKLWTADGVAVCAEPSDQQYPQIASDGSGGAIIAWEDIRAVMVAHWNIYAQRIGSDGVAQWTPGGVAVCTAMGDQESVDVAPSDGGGAIIAWEDERYGNYDIYAQKVDGSGNALWQEHGIPVSDVSDMQVSAQLVEDGEGGAIVSWMDNRPFEYNWDLYALRVDSEGYWGYPSAYISSVEDVPNDQGRLVMVTWNASRIDGYPISVVTGYDVYRSTVSGPDYSWELRCTVGAYQLPSYSFTDSTAADMDLVDPNYHHYRIVARSASPSIYWSSPPDSGYSVNNMAPPSPVSTWVAQNYPNPFNPTTTIRFEIDVAGRVTLRVYDVGGRLVKELVDDYRAAGRYEEVWDGRDGRGSQVASGVYFYSLATGGFEETRKMLLLR